MSIPGRGDLVPRRRRRRRSRLLAPLGVLLVLGAAGYAVYHYVWLPRHRGTNRPAARCVLITPTVSVPPAPAAPSLVRVRVLNSTARVGLAHQVATSLRSRGFHVVGVGNAKPRVVGAPVVRYGTGAAGAARTVAEQVPGAVLRFSPALRTQVQLVISSGYQRLATPAEAAAARTRDLAAASPRPAPSPTCLR